MPPQAVPLGSRLPERLFLLGFADTQSRGIKSAQRQVHRGGLADSRMIGEQRNDAFALAQDVFHKTVQNSLGTHFDKEARAGGVERVESFDELHRRRNLLPQKADHLRNHARSHRIKFAGDIGDNRNGRRTEIHRAQNPGQRFAGRRHDSGVEGMADLQRRAPHNRHPAPLPSPFQRPASCRRSPLPWCC